MSLIRHLPEIIDRAEAEYMELRCRVPQPGRKKVFVSGGKPAGTFLYGDNAIVLQEGVASGLLREKLDMIYCDPPFFTRGDKGVRVPIRSELTGISESVDLRAYHDRWNSGMEGYLSSLALRLMLMRDALKDTGSIFVHLDWHASHVVKLLMDEIFGEKRFINEIIWTYKSGGSAKRHLARKHDNILFYTKSDKYKFHQGKEKSYNRGLKPYHFKGVEEFEDENGWYTMVNQKDVWQIDMVGRSSSERLNYATQKPEALVKRLIELVTDPGDLCGDFYCGSGTLASAAEKAGRHFVCADLSPLALANSMKRPLRDGYSFRLENCGGAETEVCTASGHREEDRVFLDQFNGAVSERINKKDREKIAGMIEKDSFSLIDYWCVGKTLENEAFQVKKTVFRNTKGQIETEMTNVSEECDSLWVVDIFGQTARAFLR